jgi:hypothetical protein
LGHSLSQHHITVTLLLLLWILDPPVCFRTRDPLEWHTKSADIVVVVSIKCFVLAQTRQSSWLQYSTLTQRPTGSKTAFSDTKYNLNVTSPFSDSPITLPRDMYSLSEKDDKGDYSTKNPASHFRVAICATMIDLYRVSATEAVFSSRS